MISHMKGGRSPRELPLGYTVLEVMIVLAVSGVMFLIAANFINGKQQSASFTNGVNELASRIQDVIEQVSDGQYSDVPFDCQPQGAGLLVTGSTAPGKSQGSNPDCVFIGKFMHFSPGGTSSRYEVFSLAALRSSTSLGPDVTPVRGAGVDLTDQQLVPQNLQVVNTGANRGVRVTGHPGRYYGFGFTQSQGSATAAGGTYASGAQTVGLVYSPALTSRVATENQAATSITGSVAAADGVSFFVTDGDRCAQISIGGGGAATSSSQLDVNVQVEPQGSC